MNILIAHGGGPTPVMNSSLQGVIEGVRASRRKCKLYAGRYGVEGILNDDLIDLTDISESTIQKLSVTPASAIGSCRKKLGEADYPRILDTLVRHGIDCLLYNGGNDSMDTCNKLARLAENARLDLTVMGIPKTIDNDLAITDHSPGFGSAARFAAITAGEIGSDAAALPIHIVVMELMGRNAGWITGAAALGKNISKCPMMVLLPENLLNIESFLKEAEARFKLGKGLLVVVSEGIRDLDNQPISESGIVDGFGHKVPGGAAQRISDVIMQNLGIKSRSEKPGLLGRSSMPYISQIDRLEAYAVGRAAVEAAFKGDTGKMITIEAHRGKKYEFSLGAVALDLVANKEKKFPVEWIAEWDVADEFIDYCLPLLGGSLPAFAHLR